MPSLKPQEERKMKIDSEDNVATEARGCPIGFEDGERGEEPKNARNVALSSRRQGNRLLQGASGRSVALPTP